MSEMPRISAHQIDAVLPFLETFTRPDFRAGTWQTPPSSLPWFDYAPEVLSFLAALSSNGFVSPFDWHAWIEQAQQYVRDPALLEHADVTTIQKLFTTHIRADRFTEGHLAAMFEQGHIVAILRRLAQIRRELDDSNEQKG